MKQIKLSKFSKELQAAVRKEVATAQKQVQDYVQEDLDLLREALAKNTNFDYNDYEEDPKYLGMGILIIRKKKEEADKTSIEMIFDMIRFSDPEWVKYNRSYGNFKGKALIETKAYTGTTPRPLVVDYHDARKLEEVTMNEKFSTFSEMNELITTFFKKIDRKKKKFGVL